MTLFEVLYGHRCHTPFNWIEPGEKIIFCPDMDNEAKETVRRIQDKLKGTKAKTIMQIRGINP
jgi:hypothetical protein